MRVLITGSKGMLGTDLAEALRPNQHVIGVDLEELDITDLDRVRQKIRDTSPQMVINCAAYTNVDGCETNEEQAYQVNALGARNLAVACCETGAAMVQLSTDYVFPGTETKPYREDDPTGPMSVYGMSKLSGENYVRSLCSRHYIVRTSWLFGAHGPNFVRTILRLAEERDLLTVVDDQAGSPTYTRDLAGALVRLITRPAYGTYHLTNSGSCTWYEFCKEILAEAGITGVEVKPITSAELDRPAPRPAYSIMDNFYWRLHGYQPLRQYREALRDYLAGEKAD